VVRTAGEQRQQTERELADAAQMVDDLEQALDEVTSEREKLQQHLTEKAAEAQKQAIEIAQLRERLASTELTYQEHRKEAAKEAQRLAEGLAAAETDRDEQAKEARIAREKSAHLAGQIESLQAQNANLLETLAKNRGGE